MNFEEMLEQREVKKTSKIRMPYGYFYKRLIDGKYSNFIRRSCISQLMEKTMACLPSQ